MTAGAPRRGRAPPRPKSRPQDAQRSESLTPEQQKALVPPKFLHGRHIQHNAGVIHFCRVFISIVAGICAGVLGLHDLSGLIFYVVTHLAISGLLVAKSGSPSQVFAPMSSIFLGSFSEGFMSFILAWTFFHNVVYVYG